MCCDAMRWSRHVLVVVPHNSLHGFYAFGPMFGAKGHHQVFTEDWTEAHAILEGPEGCVWPRNSVKNTSLAVVRALQTR